MKSLNFISEKDNETIVQCPHCWLNFVLESVKLKWNLGIILFSVDCPFCKSKSFAFIFDDQW